MTITCERQSDHTGLHAGGCCGPCVGEWPDAGGMVYLLKICWTRPLNGRSQIAPTGRIDAHCRGRVSRPTGGETPPLHPESQGKDCDRKDSRLCSCVLSCLCYDKTQASSPHPCSGKWLRWSYGIYNENVLNMAGLIHFGDNLSLAFLLSIWYSETNTHRRDNHIWTLLYQLTTAIFGL